MTLSHLTRLLSSLIKPYSRNKDKARRERILNIILLTSITLCSVSTFKVYLTTLHSLYIGSSYRPVPPTFFIALIILFSFGLYVSRKGFARSVSFFFIFLGVFVSALSSWSWGPDLPQSLLTYSLLIVMSGILIGSRFSFIITFTIFLFIYSLTYLQTRGLHEFGYFWRQELPMISDAIMYGVTFFAVALISWLFNIESEKALQRARLSELALRRERNELEEKVIEQTKELRKIHDEKIKELYRFAELGSRVSSLLHDLATPLNVISLNLNELQEQSKKRKDDELNEMQEAIKLAQMSAQKIEEYLEVNRSSLKNQEIKQQFSVVEKIKMSAKMLSKRAHELQVDIDIQASTPQAKIHGNSTKFYQLITNLLSNALDAYASKKTVLKKPYKIHVNIQEKNDSLTITIKDHAGGIDSKTQKVMFTQFFSTQYKSGHLGLGLSICKEIVEKDFKGSLVCKSVFGDGTSFIITIPVTK